MCQDEGVDSVIIVQLYRMFKYISVRVTKRSGDKVCKCQSLPSVEVLDCSSVRRCSILNQEQAKQKRGTKIWVLKQLRSCRFAICVCCILYVYSFRFKTHPC